MERPEHRPDRAPGGVAVDLSGVAFGLVENVNHLFAAEEHLAGMNKGGWRERI